ncbi:aminomethyltransferase beta-barrel domain-containing protein, partial [Gordonia sp. NPDC003585]
PESGTVTVGTAADLEVWTITARRAVWTSGTTPEGPIDCVVQVRAHGGLAPARATPVVVDGEPGIEIALSEPLTGVARGQAAVLYLPDAERGDLVLGCGRISATSAAPAVASSAR